MTKPISDDLLHAALGMMKTKKPVFRDLPIEERRAYLAEAGRDHRKRLKASQSMGKVAVTPTTIRDILADLAVAILATDAIGSETLMSGLQTYFADRPGFPGSIKMKAKSG